MSTRYNDGSHYENHHKAAELHDLAAHAHGVGAEEHGKQDYLTGEERSKQALEHSEQAYLHTGEVHQQATNQHGIALFGHAEIAALAYELWQAREGAPKDRPKKIGSMPQNNYDPARRPAGSALGDDSCPKCGAEMEPIEIAVEGLPLRQLRLCPECYLVTWKDATGLQVRQGVPMRKGQPAEWGMGKPN